jgi:hypothetical protein
MPQGAGSGIIWDDEGHVVTNLHVSRALTWNVGWCGADTLHACCQSGEACSQQQRLTLSPYRLSRTQRICRYAHMALVTLPFANPRSI